MIYLKLIVFLLIASSQAQEVLSLRSKSKNIEKIIPPNWTIFDSISDGDLSKDGINDLVLILKDNQLEKKQITENTKDTLDLNKKILAIYFKDKNGCYHKQLQNNYFIPINSDPSIEEPYQEMQITPDGLLKMDFQLFYNLGSWYVYNESYYFEYSNETFELIKYSKTQFHRSTMESEQTTLDYKNSKNRTVKETFKEEDEEKEFPIIVKDSSDLKVNGLMKLNDLKTPFMFKIEN